MSDLKTWVSDKLMSLLGYSQPTVVQYVMTLCFLFNIKVWFIFPIGVAKKASSPTEIVNQLVDLGISSSAETVRFAKEIFSRVEHKISGLNQYQQKEREVAILARKQKTYTLLEDDDADDTVHVSPSSKKEESRKKKFRKRSEPQDDIDDDDDEVVPHGGKERQARRRTVHDEDDGSESTAHRWDTPMFGDRER